MINEILAKIPRRIITALEFYASDPDDFETRRCYSWAIFSACSTLSDLNVISLNESDALYTYYHDRLYNGGNAQ